MSTKRTIPNALALAGLGGLAVVASACNLSINLGEEGSGVPETVTYDFTDFDEVEIGGTFETDITVAEGPYSVEITVDDNLVDNLEVKLDGGQLEVSWDGMSPRSEVTPEVVISMPNLVELDVAGASEAKAAGINSEEFRLEVSGASSVTVDGEIGQLNVDGSGASDLVVVGTAGNVDLDLSGASNIDFTEADVVWATVDVSGASTARFGEADRIEGELNGASSLSAPSETRASVSTSGASSLDLG